MKRVGKTSKMGQPDYRTYTWDAEGRLIGVGGDATASYVYDAFGRRVRRTANGTTVDDLLGPDGGVLSEYDESRQAWTRTEIAAGGRALGSYNPQTGATTLNIADELGTVRARTDLAGNVQERYTSLPFGDLLTTWDDNWQPTSPEVGAISPLHFTGKPRDAETGLDDFGARLYSSSLGRWMTPDWAAQAEPVPYAKLDNPQSLNLYTYVLNNPVTSVDPDGHCCDPAIDSGVIQLSSFGNGANDLNAASQMALGGGQIGLGVGILLAAANATPAGPVADAVAAAGALSAPALLVGGSVNLAGALSKTDVAAATQPITAAGTPAGIAVMAATGSAAAGAAASVAQGAANLGKTLVNNPSSLANPAAAARAAKTLTGVGTQSSSVLSKVKSFITIPNPPSPPPAPGLPASCQHQTGACRG